MNEIVLKKYHFNNFSWDSISTDSLDEIVKITKLNTSQVKYFFKRYFDQFYLLHKIGHIIIHLFDETHEEHAPETEHNANLFAFKYLQHKEEQEYLYSLQALFRSILEKHKTTVSHSKSGEQSLFKILLQHCHSITQCGNHKESFCAFLGRISNQNLNCVNHTVKLRKGLEGETLINECLAYVFELNDYYPEINYSECTEINLETLRLSLI